MTWIDRPLAPVRWRPTREPPPLTDSAVHLWRLTLGAAGPDPRTAQRDLAPAEIERAERMRHPRLRERYLRAQIGLRRVLAAYLGAHPGKLILARGDHGKPYLPGDHGRLQFNLTTTGDLALVAVGIGEPLGVDCEPVRPRRDIHAIARRMFPPEDVENMVTVPESERLRVFHLAWTALEADVKADGRGLFRRRDPGALAPIIGHCEPAPGHVAAVARVGLAPPETWLGFVPTNH